MKNILQKGNGQASYTGKKDRTVFIGVAFALLFIVSPFGALEEREFYSPGRISYYLPLIIAFLLLLLLAVKAYLTKGSETYQRLLRMFLRSFWLTIALTWSLSILAILVVNLIRLGGGFVPNPEWGLGFLVLGTIVAPPILAIVAVSRSCFTRMSNELQRRVLIIAFLLATGMPIAALGIELSGEFIAGVLHDFYPAAITMLEVLSVLVDIAFGFSFTMSPLLWIAIVVLMLSNRSIYANWLFGKLILGFSCISLISLITVMIIFQQLTARTEWIPSN